MNFKIIFLIIVFIIIMLCNYNYSKNFTENEIPKILHLIWIGTKEQPKDITSWIYKFKEKNPDWKVKVWGNEDIKNLNLVNINEFNKMKMMAGKADIARYEILYRFGGMYLDADTLYLENPVNPNFFKKSLNMTHEENGLIMNGWFTCIKNHPFLKLAIDMIPKRDLNLDAFICVGPKLLTDIYNNMNDNDREKYDINFVDLKTVLCPTIWHGITQNNYNSLLESCKKESNALAFHWGLSTNPNLTL